MQKALLRLIRGDSDRLLRLLRGTVKLISLCKMKLLADIFPTDVSHPFFKVIERFQKEINPFCREQIFRNLFLKLKNNTVNVLPPTLFISLTSRCNLQCVGCSAHKKEPLDLKPELIDKIISEAKNKGTRLFILAGGEPFLRHDILPLLKKHDDTYFQIFTNGTLINEEIAETLSRTGNSLILFSLEGLSKDTDLRRGNDVFKRIINSMSLLKERGVLFGVSILVTPQNYDLVTSIDFIEGMIERGVFFTWFLTYKPVGDRPDLTMLIPPSQRHLLSERIVEIRNSLPVIAIDHESDMSPVGGCLATTGMGVHINAKGGLEPCGILHYFDTFISDAESVEDSLRRSELLKEIKSLYTLSPSCPLIDRPSELSEMIRRVFPETYADFEDFQFLEEYKKTYKNHLTPLSDTGRDIYTNIAEYVLKATRS